MLISCEKLSIENNVARILAADRRHKIKQSKMHAFGKALPKALKQVKTDEDYIKPLKPIFPDDLRDCKTLFKGIHHLR